MTPVVATIRLRRSSPRSRGRGPPSQSDSYVWDKALICPGCVTGQYLGGDVRTPSPSPPRDRILKCTKTEEFSSLNGKKGAEAGFRSRVGGRVYVKCTGWSGVGCEWAEMTEIQKKQNPTSVDRSRPYCCTGSMPIGDLTTHSSPNRTAPTNGREHDQNITDDRLPTTRCR